jgi:serine/threonine protein kinase/tetratricopeptide (TPR) repeat protein
MHAAPNRAKAIFLETVEKHGPESWPAFLDRACVDEPELRRRVEMLLEAHREAGTFAQPEGVGSSTASDDRHNAEHPGTVIGPYKLLQQIGEGGMGTVYMAEQTEPIRRKVALKVIKAGMDSRQVVARFEAERQALAMMDHVNIARVIDAGATASGRPYFVMELIHGVPITKYCDDNHLTPRERLELFVPVCQAIQHAHQKGIIHRDIKPSNVLVTLYDGVPVPKVIDFGVAKAMEQSLTERTLFTQFGTMVGTPQYMSPEQAEMSALGIDTRSDIYSLGVLLYELLTGSTPLTGARIREAAYAEIVRIIREEEPPKPSTRLSESGEALASISAVRKTEPGKLSKLVRGELDWIVMRTLEKDRNRRYETANAFAADVQRYLADEPVQACPPSPRSRLRKFIRRNAVALATVALVGVALVLGTLVSSWQAIRATKAEALAQTRLGETEEARKEAVANLQKAREAVDQMLTRVADEKLADVPQMEPVRKALLEDALKFYRGFLRQKSTDSAVRLETGRAWHRVGKMYHYFDQHDEAVNALRESVKLLEELAVDCPTDPDCWAALAESRLSLGDELMFGFGRFQDAEPILLRALVLFEKLAAEHPETPQYRARPARARHSLATAQANLGRAREAEEEFRSALALLDKLADEFPTEASYRDLQAEILIGLGAALVYKDSREAEKLFRRALAIHVKASAEKPNLQIQRFFLACNHHCLANLLRDGGRLTEAEEAYRQAIAHCQQIVTDFPNRLNYRSALCEFQLGLGKLLEATNRTGEAERAYRLAWEVGTDKVPPEAVPSHTWFMRLDESQALLVKLLTAAGRTQEVEAHYRQALTLWEKLAAQSPAIPGYRQELARTYARLGDFLAAEKRPEEASRRAVTLLDLASNFRKAKLASDYPEANRQLGLALNNSAWRQATRPEVELRDPRRAVELAKSAIEAAPGNGGYWNTLGTAHYRAGDWKACLVALEKVPELQPSATGFDWFFQAMAHWQLGDKDRARRYYRQAVDWMDNNRPKDEELVRFRAEAATLLGIAEQPETNKH